MKDEGWRSDFILHTSTFILTTKRPLQLKPQRTARLGDLGEELFVFGQEVVHVAGAGVGVVRVLEVEVEVAGLDVVDGDAPGLLVFLRGL